MKPNLFETLKRFLIARLKGPAAFLLYHDDCGLRWPPPLCAVIVAIGEELFALGGPAAMRDAIAELDAHAGRAVEMLWHDIGGAWCP